MPEPDPFGLLLHDGDPPEVWFYASFGPSGGAFLRHRARRAAAIQRALRIGGRLCEACAQPIPLQRRRDARHCGKGCRERARRLRRRLLVDAR